MRKVEPFCATREGIAIPRSVLHGLLTVLHIRLQHLSPHQLKQIFTRYFYALDPDKGIEVTSKPCHQCATLKRVLSVEQSSTSDPPFCVGSVFASDVIRRSRQMILVVRKTVTSVTSAMVINGETHYALRDGLLPLLFPLHPIDAPTATIRTDPAPGFTTLRNDSILTSYNIKHKNINKNPIAEKAVEVVVKEILQHDPW